MELWLRSTARTNLVKVEFLTIMEGSKFYNKEDGEFKGYTIADVCAGHYRLLGTYKTKERALEVLDEIQQLIVAKYATGFNQTAAFSELNAKSAELVLRQMAVYDMPKE